MSPGKAPSSKKTPASVVTAKSRGARTEPKETPLSQRTPFSTALSTNNKTCSTQQPTPAHLQYDEVSVSPMPNRSSSSATPNSTASTQVPTCLPPVGAESAPKSSSAKTLGSSSTKKSSTLMNTPLPTDPFKKSPVSSSAMSTKTAPSSSTRPLIANLIDKAATVSTPPFVLLHEDVLALREAARLRGSLDARAEASLRWLEMHGAELPSQLHTAAHHLAVLTDGTHVYARDAYEATTALHAQNLITDAAFNSSPDMAKVRTATQQGALISMDSMLNLYKKLLLHDR